MKGKRADMNFWLVMLVIALIFMVIIFFVMNNVFQYWGKTTGKLQEDIEEQQEKTDIFEQIDGDNNDNKKDGT